jgi:hypothetical protein
MGTLYKIDSRTLVFAPSGQGFFHSNLPARSHSGVLSLERADLLGPDDQTCVVEDSDEEDTDVDEGKTTGIPENDGREQGGFKRHVCLPEATSC